MDDLNGLHIVVTRPLAQAAPWAAHLQALNAKVSLISLMDIAPVQDEVQIRAIKNRILDFDQYNKAIFVSQNAVEYGFHWIENYWPQLPMGVSFLAVGETTANLLQKRGAPVTDLASAQAGAMTSETLLQSPALHAVAGEKILIFRGCGGRTHLGDELASRGAKVDYCELYARQLPFDAAEQFAQLLRSDSLQMLSAKVIVTLYSGEALANLNEIMKQFTSNEQTLLQSLIVLVPSARIKEQAIELGFNRVFAAENATEARMLQRLVDIKASLKIKST